MKPQILLIIGIIVALGLGSFIIFSRNKSTQTGAEKTQDARSSAGFMVTLAKESGTVSFKTENSEFAPVTTDETQIPNHSTVKTGDDGVAHLIFPDNSMASLSKNTEMQVNFTDSGTSIVQTLGNAWFRVQKLVTGKEFTVETPTTLASVRGTIFGVERGADDVVYVTESQVDISQINWNGTEKEMKNTKSLVTGQLAHISDFTQKNVMDIGNIPEEKKQTGWFRRNQIFNDEYKAGRIKEMIKTMRTDERLKKIDIETAAEKLQSGRPTASTTVSSKDLKQIVQNETSGTVNPQDLMKKFSGSNPAGYKDLCAYVNSAQFESDMSQVRQYASILGSWVTTFIDNQQVVKRDCSDNVISEIEARELQRLFDQTPLPSIGTDGSTILNNPEVQKALQNAVGM